MKPVQIFLLGIFLNCGLLRAQTETDVKIAVHETYVVTFECGSCTERNKFSISGPEDHMFEATKFPLKQELKPGEYEMTYWQNRVQQIHLPFSVSPDSENIILAKE